MKIARFGPFIKSVIKFSLTEMEWADYTWLRTFKCRSSRLIDRYSVIESLYSLELSPVPIPLQRISWKYALIASRFKQSAL